MNNFVRSITDKIMLNIMTRNPLIWNIGKLVLGAGLGQIITLIAAPLIARQFGPLSFGQQATVLSVAGPMVTLTSMAFPIAIVIARTDEEAHALSQLALMGSLIFAPFLTALLVINDMWALKQLGLESISQYTLLVPVIAVLTTINMSAGYLMTRSGSFNLSACATVGASLIGNVTKLVLGGFWPNTLSLLIGNAVGYLIAPLLALRLRVHRSRKIAYEAPDQLWTIARSHWDFAFLRAPQNFLVAISQSIPIIGLTACFGPEAAGYYALATALATAPVSLIGNAVQAVLYPRLNEISLAGGDTTKLLIKSTVCLLVAGSPFLAVTAMLGPWLFATVMGPEWQEAGVYSAFLSLWLWLGLANRPAVSAIPILGIQGGLLLYEVIGTIAKLGAVIAGYGVFGSARWTVGIFSITGAVAYALLIVWVIRKSAKVRRRNQNDKAG